MKKYIITLSAAALTLSAALTTASCSSDEDLLGGGEGQLMLSTTIASDVKVASRAATEEELAEKAIVWISNPKGAVRKYNGLANIPTGGVKLLADHYVAEVWTGDSLSASFDTKWYKGREEFDITANETTTVNIRATVANTVASVKYTDGVDGLLTDYTMTVGHERGDLTFEGRDERKGYFMMPSYDKNLKWNLQGKLANGTVYTRAGVIENVKPATEYIITVGYSDTPQDDGGGYFTIKIDERAIDVAEEVEIKLAPQFEGYDGLDLSEGISGEVGKFTRKSVLVRGVGNLTNVVLRSDAFNSFLTGDDVDLFNMEPTVATELINHGITHSYSYDADLDASVLKLNLEETFLNSLAEGDYTIDITATDAQGKTTSTALKIVPTDAPVVANDVVATDVWATSAKLTARILKADAANPGINYRKKGTQAWTAAPVTVSGTDITANLTGLEPATEYEFCGAATGYVAKSSISFTTEAAAQLPNASFENWQDSKAPYLIYGSGEQMFWDSGNHGSATMSKNVTFPATDKVHAGSRSIKLCSQFVGVGALGKFAAGNVFIGQYLATNGTDGVLGWGRPFTSRPKAVTAWIHYTPATIEYVGKGAPSSVAKGDMDTAIIYVAIVDDSTKSYTKGDDTWNYPVIVNTKTSELFSKTDANVIAYGEKVLTDATSGDAMVQITIPIEYYRTDLKASNIVLTAAASRYGDFFTGGSSVLYIDDIQLDY